MKTKPKIQIDLDKVRTLAAAGLTNEKIALALGISEATLYDRKRESKEFREAIKKGTAEGEAIVTSKLFEAARRGEAWAICFFLKCRCGWNEKSYLEVTGKNGEAIQVEQKSVLTDKQKAMLDKILDENY